MFKAKSQKWIVSFMLTDEISFMLTDEIFANIYYTSDDIKAMLEQLAYANDCAVEQIAIIQLTSQRRGGARKRKLTTTPTNKGEYGHEEGSSGSSSGV